MNSPHFIGRQWHSTAGAPPPQCPPPRAPPPGVSLPRASETRASRWARHVSYRAILARVIGPDTCRCRRARQGRRCRWSFSRGTTLASTRAPSCCACPSRSTTRTRRVPPAVQRGRVASPSSPRAESHASLTRGGGPPTAARARTAQWGSTGASGRRTPVILEPFIQRRPRAMCVLAPRDHRVTTA